MKKVLDCNKKMISLVISIIATLVILSVFCIVVYCNNEFPEIGRYCIVYTFLEIIWIIGVIQDYNECKYFYRNSAKNDSKKNIVLLVIFISYFFIVVFGIYKNV